MMRLFQDEGFDVIPFGQGYASMGWPTQRFEDLLDDSKIRHGGNPLLRWCASNVAVEIDAAGNKKPTRKHSRDKIDPIVSLIMGLGLSNLFGADDQSVYNEKDRGLLIL